MPASPSNGNDRSGRESTDAAARPLLPAPSRRLTTICNLGFQYAQISVHVVQGLLLLPLALAYLPVDLYGGWLAIGGALVGLSLLDPGVADVLKQRVAAAYGAGDADRIGAVVGSGLLLSLLIGPLALLALPFATDLAGVVGLPPELTRELAGAIGLGIVAAAIRLTSHALSGATIGLQRSVATGLVDTGAMLAGLATTVVLLVAGAGVAAFPWGLIVLATITFVGHATVLARWFAATPAARLRLDGGELRAMRGLLGVTWVGRLGTTLVQYADTFLAGVLISPTAAVVYAASTRAARLVYLLLSRIAPALLPTLAHYSAEASPGQLAEMAGRARRVTAALGAVGVFGVATLTAPFVTLWAGPAAFGGPAFGAVAALAFGWMVLVLVGSRMLFAAGAIRSTALLTLADGALTIGAQVALATWAGLGLVGIALGALIGSALSIAWLPRLERRQFAPRQQPPPAASRASAAWLVDAMRMGAAALAGYALHGVALDLGAGASWGAFGAVVVVTGVAGCGAVLASNAHARLELAGAIAQIRKRRRRTR